MRRDGPPGNAQALLDIGSILEQAGGPIARAGGADAEHLLELLRATVEALATAAGRLGAPSAPGQDRDAEAVIWLHDLRTPASAIAGWSQILGQARNDVTQIRAVEAIERNAKRLTEILSHPPT